MTICIEYLLIIYREATAFSPVLSQKLYKDVSGAYFSFPIRVIYKDTQSKIGGESSVYTL